MVVLTPLKNISQLGWLFLIYGKIKNVPNHQPVQMMFPSNMSIHRGSIPLLVDKEVPSLGTPLGSLFCTSERPMSTTALPLNSKRMSCPLIKVDALLGDLLCNPSFEPSSFKLRHNETDPWECGPLRPGKCRRVWNKACQGVNSESMSTLVQVVAPWLVYGDYNYIL